MTGILLLYAGDESGVSLMMSHCQETVRGQLGNMTNDELQTRDYWSKRLLSKLLLVAFYIDQR